MFKLHYFCSLFYNIESVSYIETYEYLSKFKLQDFSFNMNLFLILIKSRTNTVTDDGDCFRVIR